MSYTVYKTLKLVNEWHLKRLNREERAFIKSMWEAAQGCGENPTDEQIKEQCGISPARIRWIKDIAKQFLIK